MRIFYNLISDALNPKAYDVWFDATFDKVHCESVLFFNKILKWIVLLNVVFISEFGEFEPFDRCQPKKRLSRLDSTSDLSKTYFSMTFLLC